MSKQTLLINTSAVPMQVKLNTPAGGVDFAYVMARSRVEVPDNYSVDHNWKIQNPKLKCVAADQPAPVAPAQAKPVVEPTQPATP